MEATLRVSSVTVSNLDQRKKKSTHQYNSVQTIYCCHPVICCALYLAMLFLIIRLKNCYSDFVTF